MGPVEVIVATFPSAGLAAGIGPLLEQLVAPGALRVVDAILVTRDVVVTDLDDDLVPGWSAISADPLPLISADDATVVAEGLARGEVAVILAAEHTWPARFARALADSGGSLGLHARIDPEVVATACRVGA